MSEPNTTDQCPAAPAATEPDTHSNSRGWRALVPGATLRVDAGGRLVDLADGGDARLAPLANRIGRPFADALRASDRVVWLHALAAARSGTAQRLRLALCPPADGRSWIDVTARLAPIGDDDTGDEADGAPGAVLVSLGADAEALAPATAAPMAPAHATPAHATAPRATSLAELAHEFRTPLNAVRGYAQALEAGLFGPLNARQRDAVAGLGEAGEHLIEIANAVLDGARLEEARAVDPAPADPAEAVERACAILRGTASRADVTLANRVMPGAPVPHDAAALRQIVVNLVSNAVKASPPGAVVGIDARRENGALLIAVRDAGPGIPAAAARGTCGSWARGIAASGEATGGMGLPLVRRLCALHGGALGFTERAGGGTVATVRLPLAVARRDGRAPGDGRDDGRDDRLDDRGTTRLMRMAG